MRILMSREGSVFDAKDFAYVLCLDIMRKNAFLRGLQPFFNLIIIPDSQRKIFRRFILIFSSFLENAIFKVFWRLNLFFSLFTRIKTTWLVRAQLHILNDVRGKYQIERRKRTNVGNIGKVAHLL